MGSLRSHASPFQSIRCDPSRVSPTALTSLPHRQARNHRPAPGLGQSVRPRWQYPGGMRPRTLPRCGFLMWSSAPCTTSPPSAPDVFPALYPAAAAGLPTLADSGYESAGTKHSDSRQTARPTAGNSISAQPEHEQGELERDIKGVTIGDHAEPQAGRDFGETSCTEDPRRPGHLLLCPRVCLDECCYAENARLTLAEKTSMGLTNRLFTGK
jgi:hypothetical protein